MIFGWELGMEYEEGEGRKNLFSVGGGKIEKVEPRTDLPT